MYVCMYVYTIGGAARTSARGSPPFSTPHNPLCSIAASMRAQQSESAADRWRGPVTATRMRRVVEAATQGEMAQALLTICTQLNMINK